MTKSAVDRLFSLNRMHWPTRDPFLFCAHHNDHFPKGNEKMGPDADLTGRHLGNDFNSKDGWNMYHGQEVPGFPHHPHRGFETVTIARKGFIDHRDSLGAASRFGKGDVQWMTAGKGVVHSEMIPLLNRDRENHTEFFQIWLNLPKKNKLVDPSFTMFWNEDVPIIHHKDDNGHETTVKVVAGELEGERALSPPPNSWASEEGADVAIYTISMEPQAQWTIPAARADLTRALYFFDGGTIQVDGEEASEPTGFYLHSDQSVTLENGDEKAELLFLQGRPIDEPVAQRGPFVMNYEGELRQAIVDYQRTQFGGWPWDASEAAHPADRGRFAIHPDGREEEPAAS
jgi:redox-sensitive bicupin YhaK (pirin superfamily)